MTLSELYEYLLLGGSVRCDSPQQRNTLARFIQDELGFQIGPGTTDYMTRHPDGTDYMFVELYNMSNGAVVSFCVNALGQTVTHSTTKPLSAISRNWSDVMLLPPHQFCKRIQELLVAAFINRGVILGNQGFDISK